MATLSPYLSVLLCNFKYSADGTFVIVDKP